MPSDLRVIWRRKAQAFGGEWIARDAVVPDAIWTSLTAQKRQTLTSLGFVEILPVADAAALPGSGDTQVGGRLV